MNRGLYIGATSLVTNQRKMDVLSNNLANINTTGFKKDISITESFPEKLMAKKTRSWQRSQPVKGENLTITDLGDNISEASIQKGYFRVLTPRGESFVKSVRLTEDDDGYLRTSYRNLDSNKRFDYENFLLDKNGNKIRGLDQITSGIYTPPGYVIGTMSGGVNFKRVHTDFSQGGIIDTGGKLDVALMGEGFIKVQGKDGIIYTRDGSFSIDQDKNLVDLQGNKVLDSNNQPILLNGSEVNISENGSITLDGANIGSLGLTNIKNTEFLRKLGDNNYKMVVGPGGEEVQAEEEAFLGRVLQGHLEGSNMDAVTGMVEMISLMREFEANQKLVKAQDEMLEKAATEIGRV